MKRHKVSALQGKDNQEQKAKEKRRALREAMNEDFRIKYTKAFPAWTFYFDATVEDGRASLIARILALKAVRTRSLLHNAALSPLVMLESNGVLLK